MHLVLAKYYSRKPNFTKGQIMRVYSEFELRPDLFQFACALYMSASDFNTLYGLRFDQQKLRTIISNWVFKGESDLVGTDGVSKDFDENKFPVQYWGDYVSTSGNYFGNLRW